MLISIPSANATLGSLLTKAQREQAELSAAENGVKHVLIQNTGANAVYVEVGASASTTNSAQIAASTGSLDFKAVNLDAVNVIAATAATSVRILIY